MLSTLLTPVPALLCVVGYVHTRKEWRYGAALVKIKLKLKYLLKLAGFFMSRVFTAPLAELLDCQFLGSIGFIPLRNIAELAANRTFQS